MPRTELDQVRAELRIAQQHAHRAEAERAEAEARYHQAKADIERANARAARTHAEAVTTQAALAAVRRLCNLTIAVSMRSQAIDQAHDTLAAIDSATEGQPLPGDAAWHSVWLHGDWRWLTKQMTTAEREHAADAVDRYSHHLNAEDPEAEITDQVAANICDHFYETHILGGHPLTVQVCLFCRTPDWDDLNEQAAALYRWGWDEGREGRDARTKLSAYDMPRAEEGQA